MEIKRILETALYAPDLEAAEAFYRDVLGLEMFLKEAGRHVFFKLENQILLIFDPEATRMGPKTTDLPVPTHGASGAGHVCFSLDREAFAPWIARLRQHGIDIESDFNWPNGARSVYFRDPAGNSIEFAERRLWFED